MNLISKMISLGTIAFCFRLAVGEAQNRQQADEQTVVRIEDDWLKALSERDRATLDRILSDDFMDSTWKGELRNKRQMLEEVDKPARYSQHLVDLKVNLYQATAIVRGTNIIRDQTGRILTRIRFTDVFMYHDGRWRAVAAQETETKSP